MTAVTIVTSGHLVTCPRVVREAEVLAAAGYDVHVLTVSHSAEFDDLDRQVSAGACWRWTAVDLKPSYRRSCIKLRTLAHRGLQRVGVNAGLTAGSAHTGVWKPLARQAATERAALFIGHNLPGLLAARQAAFRHDASLMFDAEDWHPGELPATPRHRRENDTRWQVLSRCLPHCAAVSASSPRIAARYHTAFGVPCDVVLNTGYGDCQHQDWVLKRRSARLAAGSRRIFWVSQTIGLGRGLEDIIPALCRAHPNVSLHLQGQANDDIKRQLQSLWTRAGGSGAIEFIRFAGPLTLRHHMHQFDIGLSVESNLTANHRACLSNKLFTYMEGAIPQILSKTPAHYDLRHRIANGAVLVDLTDTKTMTARLTEWLNNADALVESVTCLPGIYRQRFNDRDQAERLLGCVEKALQVGRRTRRDTASSRWAA